MKLVALFFTGIAIGFSAAILKSKQQDPILVECPQTNVKLACPNTPLGITKALEVCQEMVIRYARQINIGQSQLDVCMENIISIREDLSMCRIETENLIKNSFQ